MGPLRPAPPVPPGPRHHHNPEETDQPPRPRLPVHPGAAATLIPPTPIPLPAPLHSPHTLTALPNPAHPRPSAQERPDAYPGVMACFPPDYKVGALQTLTGASGKAPLSSRLLPCRLCDAGHPYQVFLH